jgi:hypothetical protein
LNGVCIAWYEANLPYEEVFELAVSEVTAEK